MIAGEALGAGWNWGAIAAILVVAGSSIRSIARAFTAPDALDARFTDRQRRARAGLEADHIIPSLAHLLTDAAEEMPGWAVSQTSQEELTSLLQDELNSTDYLESLRALGRLARDHDRISSSYSGAEVSARIRGVAGLLTLLGLAYPAIWIATSQGRTTFLLLASTMIALLATAAMLGAWANETRLRTRLVRLCRDYERTA